MSWWRSGAKGVWVQEHKRWLRESFSTQHMKRKDKKTIRVEEVSRWPIFQKTHVRRNKALYIPRIYSSFNGVSKLTDRKKTKFVVSHYNGNKKCVEAAVQ